MPKLILFMWKGWYKKLPELTEHEAEKYFSFWNVKKKVKIQTWYKSQCFEMTRNGTYYFQKKQQ